MSQIVPLYISIAFLIAICFPIYMIASLAKQYAKPSHATTIFYGIIIFYGVYLVIVGMAAINGVFVENTLPPKIIQLTTFPLLIFLIGIIFNTGFYKKILRSMPVNELIYLQRFRFIGSFFLILLSFELLPPLFALIAGIGDVLTAISSLWVSKFAKKENVQSKKIVLLWNTFGLLDILATSFTAILLTKVSIETGVLGVEVLASFPFCFIPAFAPATIIFLHLSIYKKVLVKKNH